MAKSNSTLGGAKPQSVGGTSDNRPDVNVKPRELEIKGLSYLRKVLVKLMFPYSQKCVAGNKGNTFDKLRANAVASSISGTKSIILRDCIEALHDDYHGSRLLSSSRR